MSTATPIPLGARDLFLAVDLDGTFLGGADADRRALYDLIERRRTQIALAFVTGRDIAFASTLSDEHGSPEPDLIIGDVGTSVVVGPHWEPHAEAEAWIDSRWPGPARAAEIMNRRTKLKKQEIFGGRRLSYFYDDPAAADEAAAEIDAAGYAALTSADLYFDVLPRGVNKGETLKIVLAHERVPHANVLCAGDTMNDLSLFQTGLKGVVVGNAEPRLRKAVQGLDNVYCAERAGAGGILEAIDRLALLPPKIMETN
ncbi:MAG: HAD-IIB family hydrolase [Hyphomicrobium sp.]|jgi:HAD superfamily hydrolase (TIGR01484 family)